MNKVKSTFILLAAGGLIIAALDYGHARPVKDVSLDNMIAYGPGHGRKGYHRRGRGRRGPGIFGDRQRMKDVLKLSDSQLNRIEKINRNHHKKMLAIKEKMVPLKFRLRRYLLEDKVNLGKVKALLKKISVLEVQARMERIKHRIAIESVLTATQRSKLRQERHRMRRMHHRGRHGRGGGMHGRGHGGRF